MHTTTSIINSRWQKAQLGSAYPKCLVEQKNIKNTSYLEAISVYEGRKDQVRYNSQPSSPKADIL